MPRSSPSGGVVSRGSEAGGVAEHAGLGKTDAFMGQAMHLPRRDLETGTEAWLMTMGNRASAPIVLSDGTIVATGTAGRVLIVQDACIRLRGPEAGWPQAFHDKYHSNNRPSARLGPYAARPYPTFEALMAEVDDPCWNMASRTLILPTAIQKMSQARMRRSS